MSSPEAKHPTVTVGEFYTRHSESLAMKLLGPTVGFERRIKEHGLNVDDYQWYLDLRRYGTVPHSGFGMGIERCTAWIAGTHHIRETIPFPRMLHRIYP